MCIERGKLTYGRRRWVLVFEFLVGNSWKLIAPTVFLCHRMFSFIELLCLILTTCRWANIFLPASTLQDFQSFSKVTRPLKSIDNLLLFLLSNLWFVPCPSLHSWAQKWELGNSLEVSQGRGRSACVPHSETTELFCLGCVWIQLKWHDGISTSAVPRRLSFTSGLF